jgi:hypothetical protein
MEITGAKQRSVTTCSANWMRGANGGVIAVVPESIP